MPEKLQRSYQTFKPENSVAVLDEEDIENIAAGRRFYPSFRAQLRDLWIRWPKSRWFYGFTIALLTAAGLLLILLSINNIEAGTQPVFYEVPAARLLDIGNHKLVAISDLKPIHNAFDWGGHVPDFCAIGAGLLFLYVALLIPGKVPAPNSPSPSDVFIRVWRDTGAIPPRPTFPSKKGGDTQQK